MLNDRIQELALQAAAWARTANWSSNPKFGDRSYDDLYNEKFAELVAQECARVIEEHAKLFPEADTTWRCAMIESAKVVKDNFRS